MSGSDSKSLVKYQPEVVRVPDNVQVLKQRNRVERFKAKKSADVESLRIIKDILTNPVVEIVGAYVLIEALQKQGTIPQLAGSIAEAGVLTCVGFQQLAPFMPAMIDQGNKMIDSLTKALPALPALLAGSG